MVCPCLSVRHAQSGSSANVQKYWPKWLLGRRRCMEMKMIENASAIISHSNYRLTFGLWKTAAAHSRTVDPLFAWFSWTFPVMLVVAPHQDRAAKCSIITLLRLRALHDLSRQSKTARKAPKVDEKSKKIIWLWPAIVYWNLTHFDTLQVWVLSTWASHGCAMASLKDQCQGCFDAATSLFIQCRTAHLELQRVALHEGRLLNRDSVQICSDAELLNVANLPCFFPKCSLRDSDSGSPRSSKSHEPRTSWWVATPS